MRDRLPFALLLLAAIAGWWISDHIITPWIEHHSGYLEMKNRGLSILLGHWVFGQLPRVLVCTLVWIVGMRFALMPSLRDALRPGSLNRHAIKHGLRSGIILVLITCAVGAAAGGEFGFHPYVPKMAGDLVSNMYEEIVYRGLIFSAFYGVGAGRAFSLNENSSKAGLLLGTIGSCTIFAMAHEQYDVSLQIVIGLSSIGFVYPWVKARTLWSPWIAHMLVDVIADTFIEL